MKKHLLFAFCSFLVVNTLFAQKTAKRELRGAWITTHLGLDWPVRTQSIAQKQSALLGMLDQHKATGMNSMYFQVRSQSDAMYQSNIEPWAAILNPEHNQGVAPGWDPLQYAIEETHKKGMELHAWINPYRAIANIDSLSRFSPQHVARQHPEWLISGSGKERILNPGLPVVRDYLVNVITDIVSRYDVDGIHFDDYFYPNAVINDDAAYEADPRGFPATIAGRADWRRDNVSLLIERIDNVINTIKPWVKFGVSPSGIYLNGTANGGSATSGLQHYITLYADTKKWMAEGWVDYIAPQLYWYIGQPGADYSVLVPWWNNNASGRHIYIGQAIYKVNDPLMGAQWAQRTQIPNQMRMNRKEIYPNVLGEIGFRTQHLRNNPLNVRDSIRLHIYMRPALPPVMPWHDDTAPEAPGELTAVKQSNNNYILSWKKPPATTVESNKARQFVIYRSESPLINTEDTANLLYITPTDVNTYTDANTIDKRYYYTVTAVDRGYVESTPSNVTDYQPPVITCPAAQKLTLDESCSVIIPDYRTSAAVSDDVTPTQSISVTQSPAAGTVVTGAGTILITLTATDLSGKRTSCSFDVGKDDVIPPQINCNAPITAGMDAGVCFANLTLTPPEATDNCSILTVSGTRSDGAALSSPYPKGTTTITWKVTDAAGLTAVCTQTVTVEDREAPVITGVSADPAILFPPNHKMKDVTISYTATDNCGTANTTLSVTSNEIPDAGKWDWEVVNNHKVKLRAERWGYGNGRIYTITIKAVDEAGNVTTKKVTVAVPHDQGDITSAKSSIADARPIVQPFVSVSPNPSTTYFRIALSHTREEPYTVTVRDNLNRIVETRRGVAPGSTIYVGVAYAPGIYYLEVQQGRIQELIKVVKQ